MLGTVTLNAMLTLLYYSGRGDVTFTMSDDNWVKLMTGKLTPQQVSPLSLSDANSSQKYYFFTTIVTQLHS